MNPRRLVISRTDSIGDVVLTLPLAGLLKERFPEARITFLGAEYTRAVVAACRYVDDFLEAGEFLKTTRADWKEESAIVHVFPKKELAFHAQKVGIGIRIGTRSRWYHWPTCNKLVKLKRRSSDLHEAQLNARLLAPLRIASDYSLSALQAHLDISRTVSLPERFQKMLLPGNKHLILHPKSKGSALEWGLENFARLANLLPDDYQIFISGTGAEGKLLKPFFSAVERPVTDLTGQMTLPELIAFIRQADGLIANSTGPLHLAAALGKIAVGVYPSIRPMHAGRWAPLGPQAVALSALPGDAGMDSIQPKDVLGALREKLG